MKILHIFFCLLLLSHTASATAQQVTLVTPNITVQPGANVHLDISVKNFQQITAVQFSLKWDKNVLQFIGVDNFGLPGLVVDLNFGLLNVNNGELRFSWVQGNLSGLTLKDSSQLFSIWFKAVGPHESSTKLSFANEPIVIEVINSNGTQPFILENGTITIKQLTSTLEVVSNDFVLYQNVPNPFVETTSIQFELKKGSNANISIFDNSGRRIFERSDYYSPGKHNMVLNREIFGKAGTYHFSLSTPGGVATRPLVVK